MWGITYVIDEAQFKISTSIFNKWEPIPRPSYVLNLEVSHQILVDKVECFYCFRITEEVVTTFVKLYLALVRYTR